MQVTCRRLSLATEQVDCTNVMPLALRFQQQVCNHRLACVGAVNAARQLLVTLHQIDSSVRPLDTIYNNIIMAPHLGACMAHTVDPIDTIEDEATIDDQRDELLANLESSAADPPPPRQAHADGERVRVAIVRWLLAIAEAQPSVCTAQQVQTILSLYTASLGEADAALFTLLQIYEEHGCYLDFFPCVWGPAATELDPRILAGTAGQSQRQALETIDRRRLAYTVDHVSLLPEGDAPGLGNRLVHSLACYDSAFLLPLFHFVLTGEVSTTELRFFVECGALSLLLVLLSSADADQRANAYSLLGTFFASMETSKMRERRQVLVALTAIRNAVTEENQRITPCLAVFVGRAARIALQPRNELYPIVNKYLLQRPVLDLEDVPLFYNLLHSSSLGCRAERIWMLRFLAAGLRADSDYALFRRRRVLDLVSNFYDSELADQKTRVFALKVLLGAAAVPCAALDLARNRGLLAWLGMSIARCNDPVALVVFAKIMSRLAATLQGHAAELQADETAVFEELRRVSIIHLQTLVGIAEAPGDERAQARFQTTLRHTFGTVVETLHGACAVLAAGRGSGKGAGGVLVHELAHIIRTFYRLNGDGGTAVHAECASLFGVDAPATEPYDSSAETALSFVLALVLHVELPITATTYFNTTLGEDSRVALASKPAGKIKQTYVRSFLDFGSSPTRTEGPHGGVVRRTCK